MQIQNSEHERKKKKSTEKLRNKDIAFHLGTSESTIKSHVNSINKKRKPVLLNVLFIFKILRLTILMYIRRKWPGR